MKWLSHLIMRLVDKGDWKPFRVHQGSFVISHLIFAYDLLLFVEAYVEQMQVITSV